MAFGSISVTPGSGADVLTDTVGSEELQVIKIALGAEGAMDNVVDSGQQAMAASIPVVIASDQSALTVASHAVTNAGTFAVQASGTVTANAGTNLNTSLLALEAGGNLAAAATSLAALDNCISGSEAQVDVVAALPAGTNNIGDVDVASIAAGDNNIGNVDVVTLPALAAGSNNIGDVDVLTLPTPIRGPGNPVVDSYTSAAVSAAANTADQVLVASAANKQIWVYGFVGTADTADGSISLQDEDNTAKSGVMEVTRRGGIAISPSGNFSMPWLKCATDKDLEIDTVTCGFKGVITYAIIDVT